MTAAALTLLLALAAAAPASGEEAVPDCCKAKHGDPAELAWTDLQGRRQTLEDFRGRWVVLNFWATWCAPCREEFPDLVRIQQRYAVHGLQVVGASADPVGDRDAVLATAREYALNFPVLLGATTEQMEALGLESAIPATIVLDPEGKIVERISGLIEPRELSRLLDDRLNPDDGAEHVAAAAGATELAALEHHDHDHGDHRHEQGGTGASLVPS